jgi:hypothetical protein
MFQKSLARLSVQLNTKEILARTAISCVFEFGLYFAISLFRIVDEDFYEDIAFDSYTNTGSGFHAGPGASSEAN